MSHEECYLCGWAGGSPAPRRTLTKMKYGQRVGDYELRLCDVCWKRYVQAAEKARRLVPEEQVMDAVERLGYDWTVHAA